MSILSKIFSDLKQSGQKAFIPFITAGDGGMDSSEAAMFALVQNGADIIELGMPFSDPMADGPVIAKSHERAVADRKSTRLNSSHKPISYAVFCLKKKNHTHTHTHAT